MSVLSPQVVEILETPMNVRELMNQMKCQLDMGMLQLDDEVILHTTNGWYHVGATAAPKVTVSEFRKEDVVLFFTDKEPEHVKAL
jgi:hypothetical protein